MRISNNLFLARANLKGSKRKNTVMVMMILSVVAVTLLVGFLSIVNTTCDEYKNKMFELFTSSKELFNHLIALCDNKNWSYDCVWDIIGDDIIDIIPYGNSKVIVEDPNGFEYLGKYYNLEGVNIC